MSQSRSGSCRKCALQVIGDFGLQVLAALRPFVEKFVHLLDGHEQVGRRADLGLCARERADRIDQFARAVRARRTCRNCRRTGRAQSAIRTCPFDEPVGQKRPASGS